MSYLIKPKNYNPLLDLKQTPLGKVLAHRLAQPRPEAHIAPGAEHRPHAGRKAL